MRSAIASVCSLCGIAAREQVLALDGSWRVLACRGCGVRVLDPAPTEVQLDEFEEGSGYDWAEAFHDEIVARYRASLAALERVVPPGRILDVGCGTGVLLEAARARGWDAVGIDPSPYGVARARAAGFDAHQGLIEQVSLEPGSFDAVALLQVVEHVTDPQPLLEACRRALRPGGALLVATPNPASLLARAKKERWNYWIPPVHCIWYTPQALARALTQAGFSVASRSTWSPRTAGLHDGVDLLDQTRLGRALPWRVKRRAGDLLARAADRAGAGTMVEQIALRWGDV